VKTIFVVDDEKNYCLVLDTLFSEEGYRVVTAQDPKKALKAIEDCAPELLITDLKMPGMSGLELLKEVKKKNPLMPVVIMTAFGTIESAVEAMRHGAFHYVLKPFKNEELRLTVKRALEMGELASEKGRLKDELSARLGLDSLTFESEAMKKVKELVDRVSAVKTTVLIEGESGTGKELVARTIYAGSPRAEAPFIAINCGALTETLLESELFGHEKGAFTGAASVKKGRFELADRGTLFLDEVQTMSQSLQVKLLRAIQEQTFERVGGVSPITIDVRFIAATNRSLAELVAKGLFREDLYYRLNVFTIEVPPLRERKDDIMPLAKYFLKLFSAETGKKTAVFSKGASEALLAYRWPGNVRELRNAVERAVVLSAGEEITEEDLMRPAGKPAGAGFPAGVISLSKPLSDAVDDFEKKLIQEALGRSAGVHAKAARLLGISPAGLQYKLTKHGLI